MCVFQCCTLRGVGCTAGGVLRSPSRVQRKLCVSAGSAASENSSPLSVRLYANTHTDLHTCDCCQKLSVTLLLFFSASRPQNLLVYINPYGGKQQGKHIYEQKVAPLFTQAGISTHVIGTSRITHFLLWGFLYHITCKAHSVYFVVIVTEYANYARDHLRTEAELKKFDG